VHTSSGSMYCDTAAVHGKHDVQCISVVGVDGALASCALAPAAGLLAASLCTLT
jgi:hypothetical protein